MMRLPAARSGGIGDVVRDIPVALAQQGCQVDVLTPGYKVFSSLPGAEQICEFSIRFAGQIHQAALFKVPPKIEFGNVSHWVIELPDTIQINTQGIYHDDGANAPFATDAIKFACFCAAAATVIVNELLPKPDVIHLHDWHSAMLLMLRKYDPSYKSLLDIRCVYSIHNLALQGTRPLVGDKSSLHSWFPELIYEPHKINDPRYLNCINPMRTGITLADKVHTVSPTYASEILMPSDPNTGFIGGEGLEQDLIQVHSQGKLIGILNGCQYPDKQYTRLSKKKLARLLRVEILSLITKNESVDSALYIAQKRVDDWANRNDDGLLITSVGRLTDQKLAILQQKMSSGISALEALLLELGQDGVFILLGSGDNKLEQFLARVAGKYDNFIFVKGYSEVLSEALYQSGDLFLMPSSFEPCGISQMLAMRAGQPCLVHSVGGLKDTVKNNINGFSFEGNSIIQQADNLVKRVTEVKQLILKETIKYKTVSKMRKKRVFCGKIAQRYMFPVYTSFKIFIKKIDIHNLRII